MIFVPTTLVLNASEALRSMSGTCLSAAAWNTTSGRVLSSTLSTRSASRTSPITLSISSAG